MEAVQLDIAPTEDRRMHQRVKLSLLGRCMFEDRRECPCQLVDISPGGAAFISPFCGEKGQRVVAYIDQIGRLEGVIVRVTGNGFAMTINASPRKRDKLADILTWLANRHVLNLAEDRRHARRVPRRTESVMELPDGEKVPVQVIDMSLSGAALCTDARPPRGTVVRLGRLGARVVRHFDDGIAIEFMRVMSDAVIEKTIEKDFF
ncbi:PilZ domain-containing protein [Propylenella binzhouense]|uniref:PilZ domain-containing protein n=1 Tax=Propylenella binzhouense TaxID=2555902 RepID=A0A964T4P8_9HYPH|nr:PilZ domain-containing protein [Propylenella binzhouense]